MKKKIFLLPCIAAVAIATFVGAKSLRTSAYESNELLLANVEALSQYVGDPIEELHYSNTHLPCFKTTYYANHGLVTVPSGKFSATCWPNENSNKGYHSHSCNSCASY